MTSQRLPLILSAMLTLLLLAAPAGATDSGGVAAQPFVQDAGGGIVAPAVPDGGGAPTAEAAQEDTPTTPEGEEQPDGEEQPTETETTPGEESDGEAPPGGEGGTGGESGGGLPTTGIEVAALAMIGLGLLMAGLALRPTSSWPPPRDRRSRSMPRR